MSKLSPISLDLMRARNGLTVALIFTICATVAAFIIWSCQAWMIEVSSGQGRVIPSGRIKTVQNLEGGIVEAIHSFEGQTVKKGDLLVSIDPIQAGAMLAENRSNIRTLSTSIVWLQALLDEREPEFAAPEDQQHKQLIDRNRAEYASVRDEAKSALRILDTLSEQKKLELIEVSGRLNTLRTSLSVASEHYLMMEDLLQKRAASRADFLSAKSRKLDLEGEIAALEASIPRLKAAEAEIIARRQEQVAQFRSKISLRLNDASAKLSSLVQSETVDADRVSRAEVRSPVHGIVKVLHATTIGQVVKPGEDIVEIVPVDDSLLVQVEVSPKDIAFLHQGQDAVVKLTAYDYALYGALKGTVVRVGADSIIDDRGNTHFPVYVQGKENWIKKDDKKLPVLPGMVARVDIVTGHKTVFDYITKPIHRTVNGAFGER